MAIVSKSIFEKAKSPKGKALGVSDNYVIDRYLSTNKGLAKRLNKDLYLVTVHDEELWLVAVLRSALHKNGSWISEPNQVLITNLQPIAERLRFESDTGINLEKMAMSLQTPRMLTEADVALLEAALSKRPAKNTGASTSTTPVKNEIVQLLSHILERTEADIINDSAPAIRRQDCGP